jgi:hypothetical protein
MLKLNLGSHTTSPLASVGVSVNYDPYVTVNVTEGSNDIPLANTPSQATRSSEQNTVVRITTEGWQNNRMQLESITLNAVRLVQNIYVIGLNLMQLCTGSDSQAIYTLRACIPGDR